jgi:FMN phosphatase YigB (HAD superfamily)
MRGTTRGIITDWGGVLTPPLRDSIGAWLQDDGIDAEHYLSVMRSMFEGAYVGDADGDGNPIHRLERGEIDAAEFERGLAARLRRLDGGPVAAEGMLDRMFRRFEPHHGMYSMLRAARERGMRTGLLSNSWGNSYPRDLFAETFDTVVISGEVRMRKPEPQIFAHTLERIGLPAEQCVFIDDIEANVDAAREAGMAGILHRSPEETRTALVEWSGVALPEG